MANSKIGPKKRKGTRRVAGLFATFLGFGVLVGGCVWCCVQQRLSSLRRNIQEVRLLGGDCIVYGKFDLRIVHLDVHGLTDFGDVQLDRFDGHDLRTLNLGKTRITNGGLMKVSSMQNLILLDLQDVQITDDALEHLGSVIAGSALRHLDLSGTGVTDRGLKEHFWSLGNLTSLNLEGTSITDDGVRHLASLARNSRLRHLNLSGTQVTDVGLQGLADSTITSLWLDRTEVGDGGVRRLLGRRIFNCLSLAESRVTDDVCEFTSLANCLNLADTAVTNRGIRKLVNRAPQSSHLVWLNLSGTQVTDDVMDDLGRLPRLSVIRIQDSDVTAQGVEAFLRHGNNTCVVLLAPDESSSIPSTPAAQVCDMLMKSELVGSNVRNLRYLLDSADRQEAFPGNATSYHVFCLARGDHEGEPTVSLEVDIPTGIVYGAFVTEPCR